MTSWVVLIAALVGCGDVIMRSAIQCVLVFWSLQADEDGRRHTRAMLEVLQKDRRKAIDRFRASPREVPRSGDASRDIDSDERV